MINILIRNAIFTVSVCFSLIPMKAVSQSSDWEWVRAFGGKGADEINSACSDLEGNLYVAGYFQDEINLDGILLKSKGDNDILIVKFSNKGNLLWAKQAGGSYSENLVISEYAKKIKIDSEGNIIVVGCFMWEADFDGKHLKGPGNTDIFIAKYSQSGSLLWVKSFGSEQHDYLYDMDIDEENNIYLTGFLTGTFIKDPTIVDYKGSEYEGPGTTPFIASLNSEGNLKWMRRDIGKADKTLIRVNSKKIYYAIEFSSDLLIGTDYHSVSGNKDFIVQCLTTDGIVEWQRKFSSDRNEMIESLDFEKDGSVLIAGKYGNIAEFKSESNDKGQDDHRTYFSKLGPDGSISWTVNNDSPAFPGGTLFSRLNKNNYYSADAFSTRIVIGRHEFIPDGKWNNSYVTMNDNSGKISEILVITPGIIKSVIPFAENSLFISGNYLYSQESSNYNSSGGFIDFFVGKLKLPDNYSIVESDDTNPVGLKVEVFPNPSNTVCTVKSNQIEVADRINITSSDGQLIMFSNKCKFPYLIDLSTFKSGQYFISVFHNGIIINKKLTIN